LSENPERAGSVRALTDGSGNLVETYQTDPFGVPVATQGTSAQPFQFTGQQRDAAIGLYYLRARIYDPTIGRFLSRDPLFGALDNPLSLNRYLYAQSNPVNLDDPSGLLTEVPSGLNEPGPIGPPPDPASPQEQIPEDEKPCVDPSARLMCTSPAMGPNGLLIAGVARDWCSILLFLCPKGGGGSSSSASNDDHYKLAKRVADATGGVLTPARGDGWVVSRYGKRRNVVIRIMRSGGARTNYWRFSVTNYGDLVKDGSWAKTYDEGHIPISDTTFDDIMRLMEKVRELFSADGF
jgi:RHS repeat-associated protein